MQRLLEDIVLPLRASYWQLGYAVISIYFQTFNVSNTTHTNPASFFIKQSIRVYRTTSTASNNEH